MRPEMYAEERVPPRDLSRGDTVLWRQTATCVLDDPIPRIAEGGMRVDYDVKLSGDTIGTVTVPGTYAFRRLRPRWEVQ